MPIEIKELHIRVTVNNPESNTRQESGQNVPSQAKGSGASDKEAVVAECVEQVLQILQKKQER